MIDKTNINAYAPIKDWATHTWIWLYVVATYYCWSKGLINKWISSDNIWFIGAVLNHLMNIEFTTLPCSHCIPEYPESHEHVKWLMASWHDPCLHGELKHSSISESNCS